MTYHDFNELVSRGAFNEKGGLYQSNVIDVSWVLNTVKMQNGVYLQTDLSCEIIR